MCLQCFNAVGWVAGRASACKKPWGVVGVGAPLVQFGWHPPGLSVPLPPLSTLLHKNPEDRRWGNPA